MLSLCIWLNKWYFAMCIRSNNLKCVWCVWLICCTVIWRVSSNQKILALCHSFWKFCLNIYLSAHFRNLNWRYTWLEKHQQCMKLYDSGFPGEKMAIKIVMRHKDSTLLSLYPVYQSRLPRVSSPSTLWYRRTFINTQMCDIAVSFDSFFGPSVSAVQSWSKYLRYGAQSSY